MYKIYLNWSTHLIGRTFGCEFKIGPILRVDIVYFSLTFFSILVTFQRYLCFSDEGILDENVDDGHNDKVNNYMNLILLPR